MFAVANETDAATRGGSAGEDRDSAAKSDRRLEEQGTGMETPRSRGFKEVLARPNGQGTRSERTGTYVRTRGDVLRQKITEQAPDDAAKTDRRLGGQETGLQTPGSRGFKQGQAGHSGQGKRPGQTGTGVRTRGNVLRQKKMGQAGSGEGREGETPKVNLEKKKKKENPGIEVAVTPTEGYKRLHFRGILRHDEHDTKEGQ